MSNPNGRRGSKAERDVADYLKQWFPFVDRRVKSGSKDRGDIGGVPGVVIEVKDCARLALAEWVAEAQKEALNDSDTSLGVVWAKRRGKGSPADWYVVMTGKTFVHLLLWAMFRDLLQ